jgi:hypothetical protein
MAKIKIERDFATIHNSVAQSNRLSLKAKGLYVYIQSKPDDWDFSAERISKEVKEGIRAVKSGLKELENVGLLKRIPKKEQNGKWAGYDYILFARFPEDRGIQNASVQNAPAENAPAENVSTYTKKDIQRKIYKERDIYNKEFQNVISLSHKEEEHSLTNKQSIAVKNTEKENSVPIRQSFFKKIGNITIFHCPVCGRDYPESMTIQINPRDWICKDCYLQKRKKLVEFNKKKTSKKVPLNVDYERVMAYKEKTGGKIISDKERTAMEVKIAKIERKLKSGKISEFDLKY